MALSRQEVERVALLARLRLSPAELENLTAQLAVIVGYVDQLADLSTEGVEPMVHPLPLANVFAEDVVERSLSRDAALSAAPHHDDECYLVPAVLGE